MKKTVRFGLVGCGRVAPTHFDAIGQTKNAELIAIADPTPSKLHALSKELCVQGFLDYRDLISSADVDVVVICTPSGLHAEMAIASAQAGKHVILEKPMALNLSDAQKIIEAFKKTNKILTVAYQNRYNRAVRFVKTHEAQLGKLNYVSAQVYWYREQNYYNDKWHGTRAMDGGVLTNQGSHYIDLALYFKNKTVSKVSAFGATLKHKMECEDAITVNLTFSDGSIGNIQANTIAYPQNYEGSLTLFYDRATIKIGGPALNRIEYWKGDFEEETHTIHAEHIDSVYGNGHRYLIQNIVSSIGQEELPFIPGSEAIKSIEVIDAAYRSMESQTIITL